MVNTVILHNKFCTIDYMPDQHPLVCRFGAFGDMVMITPLLKRLHERSGLACDVVGIGSWTQIMFEQMPYVRNVYTIKSRKTPYIFSRDKKQLAKTLINHNYNNAWVCELNKKSYQLMRKGQISESVNALTSPRMTSEHAAEQWFRLGNASPPQFDYPLCNNNELNTELFVSELEVDECQKWLEQQSIDANAPLVCIQAGNKNTMQTGHIDRNSNHKYWHQRNWAKVVDAVLEQLPNAHVLLCGVPAEYALTLDIFDLCKHQSRIHCVAKDLPLRRLLALLSIAHSCISVDTGPAHAAAALNCDVTVLFGKADARICSPVSSQSRVIQIAGRIPNSQLEPSPQSWAKYHDIRLIRPQQVIEGWIECIGQ